MFEKWAGESVADAVVDGLELVVQGVELVGVGVEQVGLRLDVTTSLGFGSIELCGGTIKELAGDGLLLLAGGTNEGEVGSVVLKV